MRDYLKPLPLFSGLAWALWAAWQGASMLCAADPPGGPALSWLLPTPALALICAAMAWVLQAMAWSLLAHRLRRKGFPAQVAGRAAGHALSPSLALLVVLPLELSAPLLGLGPMALFSTAWWLPPLLVVLLVARWAWEAVPVAGQKPSPGPSPWLVFVAGLLFCAAMGLHLHQVAQKHGRFLGGDEPRYLLVAHSLAVDHDLDIANNLRLRESYNFSRPGQVIIDHQSWLPWDALHSKFRPGLPVLLAPFYAWGLYLQKDLLLAVRPVLWLFTAWLLAELYLLARSLTGRWGPALAAAGAAGGLMPLLIYSSLVFPGVVAAALSLASLRRLYEPKAQLWPALLLAGVCVGYLGWLHERFLPLAGVLLLCALVRRPWRDRAGLLAFWLPAVSLLGLLGGYYTLLYGVPWPSAGVHAQGSFLAKDIWQSLTGVLFDGGEGLLTYTPLWLAGATGLFWLLRHRPGAGACVCALTLAGYLTAGLFQDWHAGIGPPARYLVPLVPCLALGLAAGLTWGGGRFKVATVALAVLSLLPALYIWLYPPSVYGHRVVLDSQMPLALIKAWLPTWIAGHASPIQNTALAAWALAAAAMVALTLCLGRGKNRPIRSALWLAMGLLLAAGWSIAAQSTGPGVLAVAGQGQTLAQWRGISGPGKAGGIYTQLGSGPCPALKLSLPPARHAHPPAMRLDKPPGAVQVPANTKPGLFVWGQYLSLPAGSYRTVATLRGGVSSSGWLEVSAGLGQRVLARLDFAAPPAKWPVSLAFTVDRPASGVELRLGSQGRGALLVNALSLERRLPASLQASCQP